MENAKEVFVKTENILDKIEADKIRERLQAQREKRVYAEKLRNTRSLVDSDEDEDAADWYRKQKDRDNSNRKRSRRHKDDSDEESAQVNAKRRRDAYSSKDLKGLAIGHKSDSIKDGTNVILTLRDKGVLEEDEDVLENVNMLDDEKAAKNVENKNKKPDYKPFDDDEFDEFGILKRPSLLSKYDEEIEGAQKDMFRIGESRSKADLMQLQQDQQQGKISLSLPEFKVASEYYTADEMVKFKKTKGKRKGNTRKKIVNTETKDSKMDTKPIESNIPNHGDHGSRSKKQDKSRREPKSESKSKVQLDINMLNDSDDDDIVGPDEDLTGIKIEEDEAEKELWTVLNKARINKLKEKKESNDPALEIARHVQRDRELKDEPIDEDNEELEFSNLVLNSTAEFCRNLGDLPKYESTHTVTKVEEEDNDMDIEEDRALSDAADEDDDADTKPYRNNWNEVDIKMEDEELEAPLTPGSNRAESPNQYESKPILEEEPDVSVGVAGALKLAMNKGYLDKDSKKPSGANRASSSISAQLYTIEEKFFEDDRMGRRDRYSGQVTEFREKDNYRPDFKLDYVDEKGRMMNQKEAFRYLSHKFHGKGPGKNKVDKRMKKMEQESKLRQMSSIDTPLNTLKLLQDKQKEVQAPYIVLTGQQQRLASTASQITQISKKK